MYPYKTINKICYCYVLLSYTNIKYFHTNMYNLKKIIVKVVLNYQNNKIQL